MSGTPAIRAADGHGPEWAQAVAELVDRAASAFARSGVMLHECVSVLDLQPSRRLDAWWLRRRLEPLAHLSGRRLRYIPCAEPSSTCAPAWSIGAAPVTLHWPTHIAQPLHEASGAPWLPDGPVIILAGDMPQRLPQELLLAHNGAIHEWGSKDDVDQWLPTDCAHHPAWMVESIHAYAPGLPSAMFTLPIGYWNFLDQAIAWASRGCLVIARAPGWSTLAQMREDAGHEGRVSAETPPVNFHWLARHVPRLGASAIMAGTNRDDAVQLVASALPGGDSVLPLLAAPLSAATRSGRAGRALAVRSLAGAGDLDAALSVIEMSPDDPAYLRGTWDALAPAVQATQGARLGAWLERVMTDNPWFGEDAELLRGAGHLALACARIDLAQTALRALDDMGCAQAADLAAYARCLAQAGRLEAALLACRRALSLDAGNQDALSTRESIAQRMAAMAAPWRMQHDSPGSPLLLDPLHEDHAPMLLRQMRDPSIPSMTALPALGKGEDARAWIAARREENVAVYALMHRQLGFVGYVDMRLWKTTAFICYWIGADYQGMGLCRGAIALACELARRNGIEIMLSCAYEDNLRSLRALRKSGFKSMDVRAVAPDADRAFVMLPFTAIDAEDARQRLFEFCENTQSGLRFVAADTSCPEGNCNESDRPENSSACERPQ